MREVLAVGVGGFLGALARYGMTQAIARRVELGVFAGTFGVNVLGCLILGLVAAWLQAREDLGDPARLFLTVGLLGSFTTFSTFGMETWALLRAGDWPQAVGYALASVLLGIGALVLGLALGRRCFG